MTKMMSRIEIYSKKSDYTWDTTPKIPKHVIRSEVSYILGKRVDTATITLRYVDNAIQLTDGNTYVFSYDDRIKIYYWVDNDWDSMTSSEKQQAFIFDGTISKIPASFSPDSQTITITASSLIESLLQTPVAIDEQNKTAPELIQAVLTELNRLNTKRQIQWKSTNKTTKKDNSAFPTHTTYFKNWVPAIELIEELSSNEYTDDGSYLYYLEFDEATGDINLVWFAKDDTVSSDYIYTDGGNFNEIKISLDKDNVVNFLIYHLGKDANGNSITGVNMDANSIAKNGMKAKYLQNMAQTADDLLYTEANANPSKFDFNGNQLASRFPLSTEYPYTFTAIGQDDTNVTLTVYNDKEFNDNFRIMVKNEGKRRTDRIIRELSYPIYHAVLTQKRRANSYYQLGNIIKLYNKKYFGTNADGSSKSQLLRIHKVVYTQHKVTIELKEDEETALQRLNQ